jgi:hypothetical protein
VTKLTNPKIFERQWDAVRGDYIPTNHFIPGADETIDIVCSREREHIRHLDGDPFNNQISNLRRIGPREGEAKVNIRQQFVYHSPTGFEWGYGGSGPADLALNILGLFVPPPEAWRLHQDYKRDVVAGIPDEGMTITAESVRTWLQDRWAAEVLIQNSAEAKE